MQIKFFTTYLGLLDMKAYTHSEEYES